MCSALKDKQTQTTGRQTAATATAASAAMIPMNWAAKERAARFDSYRSVSSKQNRFHSHWHSANTVRFNHFISWNYCKSTEMLLPLCIAASFFPLNNLSESMYSMCSYHNERFDSVAHKYFILFFSQPYFITLSTRVYACTDEWHYNIAMASRTNILLRNTEEKN